MFYVIRFLKNGNVESDGRMFNTQEEAQAWLEYTKGMLTPAELDQYSDITVEEFEI